MAELKPKEWCLKMAVAVTQSYCNGGGGNIPPEQLVEDVYKKLKELKEDADKA